MFRLKPAEQFLGAAARRGVGVIARVPLASGLLTGRITRETTFAEDDHRTFNRHGEMFDVGETFSGVDYSTGVRAAGEFTELARAAAPDATAAQVALAWVAAQDGVSSLIPGARNPVQARANAAAGSLQLPAGFEASVRDLYDREIRAQVHGRW